LIALMIHVRPFRDAMCFSPHPLGRRRAGNQKDRPSDLSKGLFCLPNGPGLTALRGRCWRAA
jgi:hypothetical protein